MKLAPWLLVVAGCGDHGAAAADAAIDATAAACTATYGGNFAETASSPDACATLASGSLTLAAPSATLSEPLGITIALGAMPVVGPYSSETVGSWDARGTELVTNAQCLFVGGSDVTPTGSFTLAIDALAPDPHGTLELVLAVLQTPFIDCGADLGETVEVVF